LADTEAEAGRLYETTAMPSRLRLRPSEELNTMIRGIIARGVRKYGIDVNYLIAMGFIAMGNHLTTWWSLRRRDR
jgi:hypothetical protein